MASRLFKVRWKQPGEPPRPTSPLVSCSPPFSSLPSEESHLDPNDEPIVPKECPKPTFPGQFYSLSFLPLPIQRSHFLDLDYDPIVPCLQFKQTRQTQLGGIPSYS